MFNPFGARFVVLSNPLDGTAISGATPDPLPAGTDRSNTATTTAQTLIAANPARKSLKGQNVGVNNIGINEVGGVAAIGSVGTYTVAPGGSFTINTNRAVSLIAATGPTVFTATEV